MPTNVNTPIEGGQAMDAAHMRSIQRQVRAMTQSVAGIKGYVDSTGFHPRGGNGGGAGATIVAMILTVQNNWLYCATNSGTFINVARPKLNRRDTSEGGFLDPGDTVGTREDWGTTFTLTYSDEQTRVVSATGLDNEDQVIGPTSYIIGDEITCIQLTQEVNDDTSGTVKCLYEAVDARCWMKKPSAPAT